MGKGCDQPGRAIAYALAARRGPGGPHLLEIIDAKLRFAMALTVVRDAGSVNASILA